MRKAASSRRMMTTGRSSEAEYINRSPYELSTQQLRDILDFADANGLEVTVTAHNAAWYPGEMLAVQYSR